MIDRTPELDEVIDIDPGVRTWGGPTRRRLRLFRGAGGGPVALVTELAENRGLSVTNAAEHVWRALARRFDTTSFTMVEHYGPESYVDGRDGETFDVVTVINGPPRWQPIGANGLRRLVDEG